MALVLSSHLGRNRQPATGPNPKHWCKCEGKAPVKDLAISGWVYSQGPPVVPFYLFWGRGLQKKGYPYSNSLLEDLVPFPSWMKVGGLAA